MDVATENKSRQVVAAYGYKHYDGDQCWDDTTVYFKYSDGLYKKEYTDGFYGTVSVTEVSLEDIKQRMKEVASEVNKKELAAEIYGASDPRARGGYYIDTEYVDSSLDNAKEESKIKQKIYDNLSKMESLPEDYEELNKAEAYSKEIQTFLEDLVNVVYLEGYEAGLAELKQKAEEIKSVNSEQKSDAEKEEKEIKIASFSSMPICEVQSIYPPSNFSENKKFTVNVMFPSEESVYNFVNCIGNDIWTNSYVEKVVSDVREYINTYRNAPSYFLSFCPNAFRPNEGPTYTVQLDVEDIVSLLDITKKIHGIVNFENDGIKSVFLLTKKDISISNTFEISLKRIGDAMNAYAEITNGNYSIQHIGYAMDNQNWILPAYKWKDLSTGDDFVLYGTVYPRLSILNERGEDCVRDYMAEYEFTEEDVAKIYGYDFQIDHNGCWQEQEDLER